VLGKFFTTKARGTGLGLANEKLVIKRTSVRSVSSVRRKVGQQ